MTAALIIAAGKTDRKDKFSPEKQVGKISAIERIALTFMVSGIRRIVVVGDEDELPQKLVPSMNLIFLTTSAEGEMLDSIKLGLDYLEDKCTGVLISHADVPMFSKQTVRALMKTKEAVGIPSYRGSCGHPILVPSSCFSKIMAYSGDGGLRGAIEACDLKLEFLEVEDPGILSEGRNGIDYEKLVSSHHIAKMRVNFRLRICKEQNFYGPGVHQLLQLIEELGSLSTACRYMGISYSKGRNIIQRMEDQLGLAVLRTRQGGKDGGSSRLTSEAKKILVSYDAFQREAEEIIEDLFQKHFSDLIKSSEDKRHH